MAHPTIAVLERHLLLYRRLWRATVFSFFVVPTLFLVSIGLGVGAYVGDFDGIRYTHWILPGLMAMLAFQIGVSESTYGILTEFEWSGGFLTMRNTRVRIRDMIASWLLYVLFVLAIAVTVFLIVGLLFGGLKSVWTILTPFICGLVAVSVAAPTTAFSAHVRNDSYFPLLFRLAVVPATLFSGVFFPVEQMPAVVRPLAYLSPLWHGVELNRAAILGTPTAWPGVAHIGVLLSWLVLGWAVAQTTFRRRLMI
ncbi:ABC transporter permease [Plantactinospora sp. KLBMP9567]|uniref:ABC transporter permease n=1 Tax=Plantactinospora sp. KLBMP9567 TaxID=3085900 RepID=UPI0029821DDF|nr:ABC transporter permease [Plantactinospora sp. KLBMP9567]MDW5329513.1 ABC transporter permease [Plantactinospora sp. KLBMP9567]